MQQRSELNNFGRMIVSEVSKRSVWTGVGLVKTCGILFGILFGNHNNMSRATKRSKPWAQLAGGSTQWRYACVCVCLDVWVVFCKTVMLIDPFTDRLSSEENKNAGMEQSRSCWALRKRRFLQWRDGCVGLCVHRGADTVVCTAELREWLTPATRLH